MRSSMLLWLAAFGVLITPSAASERCLSNNEASISISLETERNLTGHWIVTATSQRTHDRGNPGRFKVDLDHATRSCNDTDIILLKTTAIIAPPSGESRRLGAEDNGGLEEDVVQSSNAEHSVTVTQMTSTTSGPTEPDTITEHSEPVTEVTSTTEDPSRKGYVQYKGFGWYKVHTERDFVNWTTARETCHREGGELLVIDSEDELKEVRPEIKKFNRLGYPWVGAYDPGHNGSWITVHGGSVPSYWWKTDRDYYTSSGFYSLSDYDGHIYKYSGNGAQPYICEISES